MRSTVFEGVGGSETGSLGHCEWPIQHWQAQSSSSGFTGFSGKIELPALTFSEIVVEEQIPGAPGLRETMDAEYIHIHLNTENLNSKRMIQLVYQGLLFSRMVKRRDSSFYSLKKQCKHSKR